MFGVRSLLVVEKVLMDNDLAMQPTSATSIVFSSGICKLVDSWDKFLNQCGRCAKKTNVTVRHVKSLLVELVHFLVTRSAV